MGTVFWIELESAPPPRLPAVVQNAPPAEKRTVSGTFRLRTLLYIEDNPANLKLVEQNFTRRPDLRLLTAVDGASGVARALSSLPDVILMDINLPGIDGFEALKRLRSDPTTAGIPVIALSANAMPSAVRQGASAGFFRYLAKPIRVREFLATLDLALDLVAARTAKAGRPLEDTS